MTNNSGRIRIAISVLGACAILMSALHAPRVSAQKADDGVQRNYNSETGKVSRITGVGGAPVAIADAMSTGMTAVERSDALVHRFAPEFGLTRPQEELRLAEESLPSENRIVTRYQQVHNGIPVIAGELIVNASDKGALYSMNGEVAQGLSLDTSPALSSETAISIARQGMVKWYGGEIEDYDYADVSLWVFDESLLKPSIRPAELVWRMEVTPADQLQPIRELVLVSAETGNISLHFNQVDTAWHTAHPEEKTTTPAATVQPSRPLSTVDNAPLQSGATWYVATTGNDANNCSTTSTPCATIQAAIDKATSGDTVKVSEGTYQSTGGSYVITISKNLTLSGGWDANTFSAQNGASTVDGQKLRAGILVTATATMDHFIIQNGLGDQGGGINISGTLTLNNSSIIGNRSTNLGGGIRVDGTLYINNSTVSENISKLSAGGIFTYGTSIIQNSTIAYNKVLQSGSGGIGANYGSTVILRNSIIANNVARSMSDCSGSITSEGYNIIGSILGNCWITANSEDQFNVNPLIAPNLTGAPLYYPLLASSPAINSGNLDTCLTTDQRGVDRLDDGACDIGAYEYAIPGPVASLSIITGNEQRIAPTLNSPYPFQLVAIDSQGSPVPNVNINFSAPVSGASGIFSDTGTSETSVTTDGFGVGSISSFTANEQYGAYNISVSAEGIAAVNLNVENAAWYVSPSGSDSNSCSVPVSPCATIDGALGKVGFFSEDTILVAQGTYTSTNATVVIINKNSILLGGWNSVFTDQIGFSTIDGQNARIGIQIPTLTIETAIDHFIIKNGNGYSGGGIYTAGQVTLTNSSVHNNISSTGGGIQNADGILYMTNTTVSNNYAYVSGGGIDNSGILNLINTTVNNNYAVSSAGGFQTSGMTVMQNSIIANNNASYSPHSSECYGSPISLGNNLIRNKCSGFEPLASDLVGIDPKLGSISSDGYHPLIIGSPAINAGNNSTCPFVDQRGTTRPQGLNCDIGAYEYEMGVDLSDFLYKTFDAQNNSFVPPVFVCDQTSLACPLGDIYAQKVHLYTAGTLDMYKNLHNRHGVGNNGLELNSVVNYCSSSSCPYQNAFWNGYMAIYGSTFALADDVVAHELTHGVTQNESNLFYFYQSGAINESFSDVWGEYYDQTNGLGNDDPSVKWLVSEDATGVGPIRSMSNPPQFGDPDKMTSSLYNKKPIYDNFWDNGGVHSNSGVNNKAVFLMVDGGTFSSKTVTPLGWNKVIQIYYEAQTNLLSSGSDYSDLYYALQQACTNLTGQYGITAADCVEVKDALDAVQMNSQPIANFNPDAPLCPTGMVTNASLTIFEDDLESGTGNWSTHPQWTLVDDYASSSIHSFYADDAPLFSDANLALSSGVPLPAGAFLHFKHSFLLDYYGSTYYDGGVLEYSTNAGATWTDAKPLFSAGQNYKGTIPSAFGNPLGGRSAFSGDSHGYVSSRYNLSTLAGQTVQFRWRLGTDNSYYLLGWFLDDVKVYTCAGTAAVPSLLLPKNNALLTDYTPLLDWNDASAATQYEVQIATDAAFTSLVHNQTALPASQFEVPADLASNTKFYWRVRGVNGIGSPGNWSTAWTFRTVVDAPVLVLPNDGILALELRPFFDWNVPSGPETITGYTIQIAKDNLFKQIVHTGNPTSSSYVPNKDLPKNLLLYWRVQTKGANGPSLWSEVRSFESANSPSTPVLSAPANNALNKDYIPLFKWKAVTLPAGTDLQHYQLQVDDNADFSSPELDDTSITAVATVEFQTINPFAPNTKFYWRVRAVNDANEVSNWSVVRYFRTALVPPTLVSPVDAFASMELRPKFDWTDVATATGYTIQISKNDTFTQIAHTGNPVASTYVPTADLPKNMTLYWRVLTKGANGPSVYSDDRSFTTPINPPPAVSLLLPASNFLTSDYTPTFTWKAVVIPNLQNYILQVDDNADFGTPEVNDTTSTADYTPAFNLASNTKFYWRVRAVNTLGEMGNWSAVKYFRTIIPTPTLLSPADASAVGTLKPTFDWTDASGTITGYTIQISTNANFSSTLVNATTVNSTYTPINNLPAGKTLYWRVKVNGANGPSSWSAPFYFITP